jgi:hypothetical protein
MTATLASPESQGLASRSIVLRLGALEAKRYARHPLFLVGVALVVVSAVSEVLKTPPNVGALGLPIEPAMGLGVFGLIVAARLTRSTTRALESLGAPPVPERYRTAAMALACLVPAGVALVWSTFMLIVFSVRRPRPEAWWFDTLPAADIICYYLAAAVVAAYGGPILGVVVGRYLRWSGAPLVVAVLLVAVTILGSGLVEAVRPYRQIMPWTGWYGGDNGAGADLYYQGNPRWWLLYTICLCALAVVAALLHDRELPRRKLQVVAAVLVLVAVLACVASITTGPQQTQVSPPVLHPEQVR